MKALKYHSPWNVVLDEVDELHAIKPDDVVIDVKFCGICGTDVGIVSGTYPAAIPGVTLGHEATGVVAETGKDVVGVAVGDRVVVNPTPYCGRCRMCRTQRVNHCTNKHATESGVSSDGAYAGRFRTTSDYVYRLPDHVSMQAAALTEPLSCVIAGVHKVHLPTMAAYTFVFGAGPLGVLYAWVLWLNGLLPAVVEVAPARRSYANRCLPPGVHAYSSLQEARIRHFDDPRAPLDIVVDTTSELLGELYPQIACGGTFLSIGLKERTFAIDGMQLANRSLSLIGSIDSVGSAFVEAFHLITSGRIPVDRLISHVLPLACFRDGFAAIGCDIEQRINRRIDTESCKVLLSIEDGSHHGVLRGEVDQ